MIKLETSDGGEIWCEVTKSGSVVFYLDENREACSSAHFKVGELSRIAELVREWHQKRQDECDHSSAEKGVACGCWICPDCGYRNSCYGPIDLLPGGVR